MIRQQLEWRGVKDPAVLSAMERVPREAFVPEWTRTLIPMDGMPAAGQGCRTVFEPVLVACMIEWLGIGGDARVLEIGTGTGYGAAVLSRIARTVYTVEPNCGLAEAARERFARLGYANIHVLEGDGNRGWPEHIPYDAVVGAIATPEMDYLSWEIKQQLVPGAPLVFIAGASHRPTRLIRVRKPKSGGFGWDQMERVRLFPASEDRETAISSLAMESMDILPPN